MNSPFLYSVWAAATVEATAARLPVVVEKALVMARHVG